MNFVAFERAKQGTGASRRLRNSGRTPGIVYGGSTEPQAIELDHNALWHALKKESFHASVLEMEVAGTTSKVLLRDVQYHPYKQLVLHVDFQRVDAKTRMHMKVPVHFTNVEESPAVNVDKCTVNTVITELNVSCMPKDIPEFIAVDVSSMKKGESLHLKDIKLPKGVTAVIRGSANNPALVTMMAPLVVVEAPAADAAIADAAPAKGKGKKK